MQPAYLVGAGGVLGALLRYLITEISEDERFPVSTLAVNSIGSLLLGFITFSGLEGSITLFLGVGACGSFTTFSSFSFETFRMWEKEENKKAVINATLNLALSLTSVGIGFLLTKI